MRRAWIVLASLLVPAVLAIPAQAAPVVVAERAGPLAAGVPAHPEGGLGAVRASAASGALVGIDVAVSADGVPLAFADEGLERLTACAGPVAARLAAELTACPVRWLGSPGGALASASAPAPVPIATLRRALEVAAASGARVLLSLDRADAARLAAILAAVPEGLPPGRIVVRSADPGVLRAVRSRLRGAERALATPGADPAGPAGAAAAGVEWIAPGGPLDPAYLAEARARGRRVLAGPADDPAALIGLAGQGVDAVATHDPAAAVAAFGPLPAPVLSVAASPPPAAAPELLFPALASDGVAGPRVILRWRAGEGTAPSPSEALPTPAPPAGEPRYDVEVRPRESRDEADWRSLVADAPATFATFTGAPGAVYDVRARSRPPGAGPGAWALAPLLTPREPPRARGWQTVRRPGAWEGRIALARRPGSTLRVRFRGSSVSLVAPRTPGAGRLRVTLDGRRFTVSARGPAAARQVVWSSPRLAAGAHRLAVRALGGGPVAVDAIAPG